MIKRILGLIAAICLAAGSTAWGSSFLTQAGCWISGSSTTCNKPVAVASGGTGQSTLTNHGVLVGAGTSAVTQLAVGGNGTVLIGAASADPTWSAADTTTTHVLHGGTAPSFSAIASGDLPAATNAAAGSITREDYNTASVSFTGPCTAANVTIRYALSGKNVCLTVPSFSCPSNTATGFQAVAAMPSAYRPAVTIQTYATIINSGSTATGLLSVDTGGDVIVWASNVGGSFSNSGTAGLNSAFVLCYTVE